MNQEINNNKTAGLIGTLLFHGLLFLLFWLIIFKTPIPPFPEEGGSGYEVNFGYDDAGSGAVQPQEIAGNNETITETDINSEPTKTTTTNAVAAENVLTHENGEESVEMNKGKSETKPAENAVIKEVEKPKEEVKKANPLAMYKGKKKGSAANASEGENGGKGDQGSPDGSMDSKYHGKGGNGGVGEGDGKGNGTGDDIGNGNKKSPGISFSLEGRKPSSLPIPKANFNEEGKVVVEIKVDQNGVVVSAKPGAKGSTTTNPQLMEIARKAALTASFNTNHDAPEVQRGTIVYNFILR